MCQADDMQQIKKLFDDAIKPQYVFFLINNHASEIILEIHQKNYALCVHFKTSFSRKIGHTGQATAVVSLFWPDVWHQAVSGDAPQRP